MIFNAYISQIVSSRSFKAFSYYITAYISVTVVSSAISFCNSSAWHASFLTGQHYLRCCFVRRCTCNYTTLVNGADITCFRQDRTIHMISRSLYTIVLLWWSLIISAEDAKSSPAICPSRSLFNINRGASMQSLYNINHLTDRNLKKGRLMQFSSDLIFKHKMLLASI